MEARSLVNDDSKATPPSNEDLIAPGEKLDDLALAILQIELTNPGVSATQIAKILGRKIERKTINVRRNLALYRRAVYESRKTALELAADAEVDAIRKLTTLLKSTDEKIQLGAAKALVGGTLEYRRQQLAQELARQQITHPVRHVVEVQFGPTVPIPPGSSPTLLQDAVDAQIGASALEDRSGSNGGPAALLTGPPEPVPPAVEPANQTEPIEELP